MSISLRKYAAMCLAAVFAVGTVATVSAAALDQPVAILSSKLNSSVGTVLTASEIKTAEQSLAGSKTQSTVKTQTTSTAAATTATSAAATPAVTAPIYDDPIDTATGTTVPSSDSTSSGASAAATGSTDYSSLLTAPVSARTVAYSASLLAGSDIKAKATSLGSFKLTFYCPCAICNGTESGITASGTTALEGRTIAVDPNVIPVGSRVYIDGYGLFIAEDTGGAISDNKIDIFVSTHDRALSLGVQTANVYLVG